MNVLSMKIKAQAGGLNCGVNMLQLELGAGGGFEVKPEKLVEEILLIFSSGAVRLRNLVIFGASSAEQNMDAGTLIQALTGHKILTTLRAPGSGLPGWGSLCQVRIAEIEEPEWAEYFAQELVYKPTLREDLKVGIENLGNVSFVLEPPRSWNAQDLLEFLRTSRWNWRMASRPDVAPVVDLAASLRKAEEASA